MAQIPLTKTTDTQLAYFLGPGSCSGSGGGVGLEGMGLILEAHFGKGSWEKQMFSV